MPDCGPIVLHDVDLAVGETLHRLEVGEVALGVPIGRVAVLEIDARSALQDPGIVGQELAARRKTGLADTDVVYVARLRVPKLGKRRS